MSYPGISTSGNIFFSLGDGPVLNDYGVLEGDVAGGLFNTIVSGIAGFPVEQGTPILDQILKWDGNKWALAPDASGAGGAPHGLLSGTHTDTATAAVTRGSIIYGDSTPEWNELTLGTNEFVLFSDGTDVAYTRLGAVTPFSLGTEAAPAMTFTGDLNTGWSAAVGDELVGSAGGSGLMTLDGGNLRTNWVGGQAYHVTSGGSRTLTDADNVVLVDSAPATITLPASPFIGQLYYIKDSNGNSSGANRITIGGNGNNIDGNTQVQIKNAYAAFSLVYTGAMWNVL